jgi:hypothetical protein
VGRSPQLRPLHTALMLHTGRQRRRKAATKQWGEAPNCVHYTQALMLHTGRQRRRKGQRSSGAKPPTASITHGSDATHRQATQTQGGNEAVGRSPQLRPLHTALMLHTGRQRRRKAATKQWGEAPNCVHYTRL